MRARPRAARLPWLAAAALLAPLRGLQADQPQAPDPVPAAHAPPDARPGRSGSALDPARSSATVPSYWLGLRAYSLPLNNPALVPASEARHMDDDDLVVGLRFDGIVRAYPWWILTKYHVVNDTVEGDPVYLALCEACSAASAFLAIAEGAPLELRICGIGNGTFAVCDYESHSRWHPFLGVCLEGPRKGTRLKRLPVYHARWGEWRRLYPDSDVVLGSEELRSRPHAEHAEPGAPGLPQILRDTVRHWDGRLKENELVLGLVPQGGAKPRAYALSTLRKAGGFLQDSFDGRPIAVILRGEYRASSFSRRLGSKVLDLRVASRQPLRLKDSSGTLWDEWGTAVVGPSAGETLEPEDGYVTEWYEWFDANPESELDDRNR